jgi:hypothetical protein
MSKEFLNWLEKQEYDWNIPYNQRHRIQGGGRIWMLKNVYREVYSVMISGEYEWKEIIVL